MALLEIKDLKVSYGFITALKGINIKVDILKHGGDTSLFLPPTVKL